MGVFWLLNNSSYSKAHKQNTPIVLSFCSLSTRHSPLKLVVRWRVLCCDVGQLSKDLATVDSEAGEQDELLPGGAEQAGVVLYGELTEEGQLLDPGDLAEEQLVCQTAQQSKQLHLCYLVPSEQTTTRQMCGGQENSHHVEMGLTWLKSASHSTTNSFQQPSRPSPSDFLSLYILLISQSRSA